MKLPHITNEFTLELFYITCDWVVGEFKGF